ncbi:MAG: T9SS type A sorting domain-containing protein, partial [Crocinitomix sp.]|nr:T9SS type A sorting domain-containing protein [Crocinitomix sp.]
AFILKLTQSTDSVVENGQIQSTFYPNPATTFITLQVNENIESVLIYNLQGELVQTATQKNISIENLKAGLYLMTIKTSSGISQVKFVKE